MKICLIEPPRFVSLSNPVSTIAMPPIGLAYIAASLEAAGHEVSVVNAISSAPETFFTFGRMHVRGLTPDQIADRIPSDTDMIGVGLLFSSNWPLVRTLINTIKQRFPDRPLVLGGEHASGLPQLSLEQSLADALVIGEGEETAVELAHAWSMGGSLGDIRGLAFRRPTANGTEVVVNPRRARRRSIDEIPLPAWHLFDLDAYIRMNQPHGASRGRFMPMLATRGCPFQCTFCTSPQMWTQLWMPRDARLVVDEMELYHDRYGTIDFQFEDLTAIVRKDWIIAFCDEILRRNLKISFQLPSGTRSEAIDAEAARRMKAAGCHEFAFAPESGDPRVLKAIKKQVNLEKMFQSAADAMAAGINVGCFFILGLPEDDHLSVLRTYRATAKCAWMGFAAVNFSAYSPQPDTESFRALQKAGRIPEIDDAYLLSLFEYQDFLALKKSYNSKFSDFKLTVFIWIGFSVFYSIYFLRRPQRFLDLVVDVVTRQGRNKTSKIARSVVRDGWRMLWRRPAPKASTIGGDPHEQTPG